MGLLASISILFHRYTQERDIIIGSPTAGRDHADLEDQIGFYINTLVQRTDVDPTKNFQELYQQVKEQTLEAFEHQRYPFDHIVESLNIKRDTSRNAVFDVMLTLQNVSDKKKIQNIDSEEIYDQGEVASKFDLELVFEEVEGGLEFNVVYNTAVYEKAMIERMMVHYKTLLGNLCTDTAIPIGEIDYLTEQERHQLLYEFSNIKVDYPKDLTVVDLFDKQVKETPENIAAVVGDEQLTYEQLDKQSNALANYLLSQQKIHADDLIGIKLERNLDLIVSIVGVLKSGAAYVPIDPDYPESRIKYIEQDSQCKLVIDHTFLSSFKDSNDPTTKPEVLISSNDLMYIIYTSGTSGNPKGVMIEHQNVVRLFYNDTPLFDFGSDDVWTLFHSYCFDFSIWEIFGALLFGGKLVIVPSMIAKDPFEFIPLLEKEGVTILNQTPSSFFNLLGAEELFWNAALSLRYVIFGGEALYPSQLSTWKDHYPKVRMINMYGITETTVHVTYREINEQDIRENISNIGKSIPTLSCYILDDNLQPLPIGSIGELHVTGAGVSRGYLHQEELTREKFISNPFEAEERMYRTGDLVKMLPDGTLEYIGRKDRQIQLRGYRIELGEIESILLEYPNVYQAAVLVFEFEIDKNLIAYVQIEGDLDLTSIQSYLKEELPSYMIPQHFVKVNEFPLTSNGKLDRKALPKPTEARSSEEVSYISPETKQEKQIVKIWRDILGRKRIGMEDNFFDLGGHSLKLVQLINKYHRTFKVRLKIEDVFRYVTPSSHRDLLLQATQENYISIEKVKKQASYDLSFGQRRLWVLSQFSEGSLAYNMPFWTPVSSDIDIAILKRSVISVIERHEILRTVFKENEQGEVSQLILRTDTISFQLINVDLSDSEKDSSTLIREFIVKDTSIPFDLSEGPLLRAYVLNTSEQSVLYYNMHHIISDGWSMNILSRDVLAYYAHYKEGISLSLPKLEVQYKDYAHWQLSQFEEGHLGKSKTYWSTRLSGTLPILDLPSKHLRPSVKTYNGSGFTTSLSSELTHKLQAFIKKEGGSLFMGLIASWSVLLHRYTSENDIIIGTPIAGRNHPELEDQIGFYINTLALRHEVVSEDDFSTHYQKVKEKTVRDYEHQNYPFDKLVDDLNLKRDTSRSPLFDVMLVLQNTNENNNSRVEDSDAILPIPSVNNSKFDLGITFEEVNDLLRFDVVFNHDVYDQEMILRLMYHYKQLLSVLLDQPKIAIGFIEYLNEQERHQLLTEFNQKIDASEDETVLDLFQKQVKQNPDKIALTYKKQEISYQCLDQLSNEVANCLKTNHQVKMGDFVGIQLERSEWMIICLLGVMKSGAAYVPIDPSYPENRITHIREDSRCVLVITKDHIETFKNFTSEDRTDWNIASNQLAYMVYTSGSTQKPKGVMIAQKALTNYLLFAKQAYRNDQDALNFGLFTSLSFDLTVTSIYLPLISGGLLKIMDAEQTVSEALQNYLKDDSLTHIKLTPAHIDLISALEISKSNLKAAIVGGDTLKSTQVNTLQEINRSIEIYNEYGPTEATVGCAYQKITNENNITIGKPIANTQIYILNESNGMQPVGVAGELCIAGNGLANGYWNLPELTQEKFINNPFNEEEKLYKTGDLARWTSNGELEFLGRNDFQVKIRGYRIELNEVEESLLQFSSIDQVVILLREDSSLGKFLVAFFHADEEITSATLRSFLNDKLPAYMIPKYFVQLDQFPLTTNGKIDRKALPNHFEKDSSAEDSYAAPRNEMEENISKVWEEILGISNIGIHNNFFELGGDSILSIQMLNQLKALGLPLELSDLFKLQTIAEIAENKSSEKSELTKPTVKSDKPSMFLVPGLGGSPLALYALGAQISDIYQPIYLEDPALNGIEPILKTVEEMAAYYITKIESQTDIQETVLVGYSFGGSVAYEMGRQLSKQNKFVKHIILLDTIAPHINNFGMFNLADSYAKKIFVCIRELLEVNQVTINLKFDEIKNKEEKDIFAILTDKLEKFGDLNLLDFLKVYVRQSEASIRYNVKSKIKIVIIPPSFRQFLCKIKFRLLFI